MAGKSAERYLPCPGRIVTCRRGGCMRAATDAMIQLCAIHLTNYELECGRRLALAHRAFPSTPPPSRSPSAPPQRPVAR